MTKILIVRHGNTFDPDETPRRVGARTDLPLTQSGVDQARGLGVWINGQSIIPDYIVASELQRAQETAMLMARDAGAECDIETDDRFNEIDHGPDENLTEAEIIERIGRKALEDWDDYNVVPDGWVLDPRVIQQSWIDFSEECLSQREGQVSCVVSSGGIIRFAPVLLDEGLPDNISPKVKTAAASLFTYDGQAWRCDFWNVRAC